VLDDVVVPLKAVEHPRDGIWGLVLAVADYRTRDNRLRASQGPLTAHARPPRDFVPGRTVPCRPVCGAPGPADFFGIFISVNPVPAQSGFGRVT
jgi:hypothetical protein